MKEALQRVLAGDESASEDFEKWFGHTAAPLACFSHVLAYISTTTASTSTVVIVIIHHSSFIIAIPIHDLHRSKSTRLFHMLHRSAPRRPPPFRPRSSFVENHPEQRAAKEREAQQWEAAAVDANQRALIKMRSIIPLDITEISKQEMIRRGVPQQLAKRIYDHKASGGGDALRSSFRSANG